jgi:tetratricopeptide (TPR) repeat protein
VGFLNVRFLSVINSYDHERSDLLKIEADYLQAIDDLGVRASTVQLVRNLANLQAFYLEKTDEAIRLLESTLELPNVSNRVRGECRVELADILLLTGEVWDATLLYSQVDRMFRDDPLAHEAKFKNARLSYFIGEFDWAKAQLDILKAGTSRLISNDAMGLSLHIQDNLGVNGDPEPLKMFARAEQYEFMNRFDEAFLVLDSIQIRFPEHQINDNILFARASLKQKTNQHAEADSLLAAIVEIYPQGVLADEALFKRAELYHYFFEEHDTAMSLYRQLLTDYPGSLHTITARARFRELRGDVVN